MRPVRASQLTEKQAEVLLELYKPIRLLAEFHGRHPDDDAFWLSLDRQRQIDPNGRIISRLFNLGLVVERRHKARKLSAAGVDIAGRIYRKRHGELGRVA